MARKKLLLTPVQQAELKVTGALSLFAEAKQEVEAANELLLSVITTNTEIINSLNDENTEANAKLQANKSVVAKLNEFVL